MIIFFHFSFEILPFTTPKIDEVVYVFLNPDKPLGFNLAAQGYRGFDQVMLMEMKGGKGMWKLKDAASERELKKDVFPTFAPVKQALRYAYFHLYYNRRCLSVCMSVFSTFSC